MMFMQWAMSVVASRVLENPNTEAERLLALYQLPSIAQKVQQYLHFTDTMLAAAMVVSLKQQ